MNLGVSRSTYTAGLVIVLILGWRRDTESRQWTARVVVADRTRSPEVLVNGTSVEPVLGGHTGEFVGGAALFAPGTCEVVAE